MDEWDAVGAATLILFDLDGNKKIIDSVLKRNMT
jgi:hypothetical protein